MPFLFRNHAFFAMHSFYFFSMSLWSFRNCYNQEKINLLYVSRVLVLTNIVNSFVNCNSNKSLKLILKTISIDFICCIVVCLVVFLYSITCLLSFLLRLFLIISLLLSDCVFSRCQIKYIS